MVVIEPAEPIGEEKIEKVPQTKPVRDESASSAAATAVEDSLEGEDNTAGYASDGFETASEAEVNDDVLEEVKGGDEDREWNKDINKSENGEKDDAAGVIEMDRDKEEGQQQRQVELNEEEINEKALAEANDAKLEGNTFFKDAMYDEALSKYDIALQAVASIPTSVELRSVCHANRAACYYKLGKFEDTIKECTKSLELNPKYVKVLLRRAEAHEKLENFEGAITDLTKVLEVDPTHDQARRNFVRLKPLADEKREKMKEEMIGKLKDMGNSILGRFGMSVDNFKAVKDPNTGSYSISFQR